MKGFKKIIFTILALAIIVTSLTVIALATDSATTLPDPALTGSYNFSDKVVGAVHKNTMTTPKDENGVEGEPYSSKDGIWIYAEAADKNVFLSGEWEDSDKTTAENWDVTLNEPSAPVYAINTHPAFAFDFDIMSSTGNYVTGSVRPDLYGAKSGRLSSGTTVKLSSLNLPKIGNVWSHVTFIFRYEGNGVFGYYFYVNGVQTYSTSVNYTTKNFTSTSDKNVAAGLINWNNIQNAETGELLYSNIRVNTLTLISITSKTTETIGWDNLQFRYYPTGYTNDMIASYVYNSSYPKLCGVAEAKIGDVGYDDVTKAVEAAGPTDTVRLTKNADTVLSIDKEFYLDTNVYDADGNKTGSHYTYSYTTTKAKVPTETEEGSGIYHFARSVNAIDVIWDPACEGDCDCFSEYGGHALTAETLYMLGDIPAYPKSAPTFDVASDYTQRKFLGWSYENDGTADELVAITAEEVAAKTLKLYPVYETFTYSFEVTTTAGDVSYYTIDEYTAAMTKVAAGGTIKLLRDVTVDKGHVFKTRNASIVIDLNGHSFNKFSVYNYHYSAVYNEETKTYSKGAAITTTVENTDGTTKTTQNTSGTASAAFTISATGVSVNIKNSGGPANIYTFTLYRDLWLDENGVERGYSNVRDVTGSKKNQNSGAILFGYQGAASTTITIDGENITYYGACLVLNEWGGNQNTSSVIINGGTYYVLVDTYLSLISQLAGGTVRVSDATLVTNGNGFVRVGDKVNTSSVTKVDFKFTNCDIIDGYVQHANTTIGAEGIVLENCRYYTTGLENQKLTLGRGTHTNSIGDDTVTKSGMVTIDHVYTKAYNIIDQTKFIFNPDSIAVSYDFTTSEHEYVLRYATGSPEEDMALINWIDPEGYIVASTYALKNCTATPPALKVPVGDGWRGCTNVTTWTLANGEDSGLYVGDGEEYDFFAVLPPEEEREYAGYLTGAMFNMVYFTNFAYNIYIPKVDNVKIIDIGGTVPENVVYIRNVEYWTYTTYVSSIKALEDTEITLKFAIDGVEYSAKFKPSAIFYANTIVTDPYANADEKELVGTLIRYIDESYSAYYETVDEAVKTKLEGFYSLYTPKDYITEYPDAELFDSSVFSGLLHQVNLMIDSGKVRFMFTLTDAAAANGYQVKAKGLTGALYTNDGKVFYSDNTPLRTHVMETFTLSITDKDGNILTVDDGNGTAKEVSSSYSLAAYVNETGNTLAKALYAFGAALRAYYPVSDGNYQFREITIFGEGIEQFTIAADVENKDEYFAAEQLQSLIYSKSGIWLEIVPSAKADKSIVISLISKTGADGFSVEVHENQIIVTCEYADCINKQTLSYFKDKLSGKDTYNFNADDGFTKNVRDIFYSEFGAVGDGVTDDSEAIRAAHVHANKYNHTVCADEGKEYYIGPMLKQITIKTDVNWGNAHFIIDDSNIGPDDAARSVKFFNLASDNSDISYTPSTNATIAAINAAGGIDKDKITVLDLGIGKPAMLQIFNNTHKNYVRYGPNANNGASQQEVILVDAEGNIDPTTPFMFDYEYVSSITVHDISDAPITIDGGVFTTIANQAPCAYTSYARNIQIARHNVTIRNITHYITGEGETGAPYGGFVTVHTAYNVLFEGCKLSAHKTYHNSEGTGMGTYDISCNSSVNVTWKNCTQINFFSNEATGTPISNHWGIMGSSYSKNIGFDGCRLSRFDAHQGIYNVHIKDTEIVHTTIVGGGNVTVENSTIYNNVFIELRSDYGNFWHGNIMLKNNTMITTKSYIHLMKGTWYNHNFGYYTSLPDNFVIDGLEVYRRPDKTASTAKVYLYSEYDGDGNLKGGLASAGNNKIDDEYINVYDSDNNLVGIVGNRNPMPAPERVVIRNCAVNIILPDVINHPWFETTEFDVSEKTDVEVLCTTHFDHNKDLLCDDCSAVFTPCTEHLDKNKDGRCVYCGGEVEIHCEKHIDREINHKCDICRVTFICPDHIDEDGDNICDLCLGAFGCYGEHTNNNSDGYCDYCFAILPCMLCYDNNSDGVCDKCSGVFDCKGKHTDINADGICDDCDRAIPSCEECTDADADKICDVCLGCFGCPDKHVDAKGDGACDSCRQKIPNCPAECVDNEPHDAKCDHCGANILPK